MTLKSKSFQVYKGDSLDFISRYIEEEIGLNAYLIKDIEAVVLSPTVTQITILYDKYPSKILDSIAPRQGAIFTSDVGSNDFDVRFLFNYPIDFRSIVSGTFKIDTNEIDVSKLYLDPNSNNYFLKLKVDSPYQSEDFHTYQVSNTLKRIDGSKIDYSPVGGYIFHGLSSAHIGDIEEEYSKKKRGKVTVGVLRLSKGLNPQQGISEYLSQRQISNDMLISYTSTSTSETLSDVYIVYFSKLEPQIIGGFPLNNSLLPNVSAPNKVTLVFNVPLDNSVLKSTPNLFTIEEGFTTSTPVDPSDITLLGDLRTVEIDVSSYFTAEKVYSIIARPGILGLNGLYKEKPEQWTIHISAYEGTAFTGSITGGSGAPIDAQYVLYGSSDPDLDNAFVINFNSGLTGVGGGGSLTVGSPILINHTNNSSNPHSTTAAQVGAPTTSQFTGHTGLSNIHFTQSQISIPSSQISDFSSAVSSIVTTDVAPFISALIATDTNLTNILTGHTGTTNIHFTQSQISIPSSQINDFNSQVIILVSGYVTGLGGATGVSNSTFTGHTGNTNNPHNVTATQVGAPSLSSFTGHTGQTNIHFTVSSIDHRFINAIGIYSHDDIDSAIITLNDHIADTANPHVVTAAQVGSPTTAQFTGHTGLTTVHFTQAQISIPSSQISDFSEATQDAIGAIMAGASGITVLYSDAGNSISVGLSGWLYTGITGHIGRVDVHYPQSSISIPVSQLTDFNSSVISLITGNITGKADRDVFTGHTGLTNIHFTQSQISITASQVSDFASTTNTLINNIAGPIYVELLNNDIAIDGKITGHTGNTTLHYTQGQIDIPIGQLSDVDMSVSPSTNNILKYSGGAWRPGTIGEFGGGANELDDLIDVSLNASPEHLDVLVYSTGTSQYINAKLLGSSIEPLLIEDPGGNFLILSNASLLERAGNLIDLDDINKARKNLKVNYQVEDLLDYYFLSAADLHTVGSSWLYSPTALSFVDKDSAGVMFVTNGISGTAGGSAAMRAGTADVFNMHRGLQYYFKTAMNATGNCIYRFGMVYGTFNSEDDIANGLYYEYNSSSGNTWYACTASGNSRTKTNTFLTGSHTLNNWRWFGIEGNTGTAKFYLISGTTSGTVSISTTIPHTNTGDCRPFMAAVANGTAWNGLFMDKFIYPITYSSLPINIG